MKLNRPTARYTRASGSRLVALALGVFVALQFIPAAPLPGQYPSLEQFSPIRAVAGAISFQPPIAASYDGTRSTQYRNGDKPVGGCTPPTGFTEYNNGDGAGVWCENSSTSFSANLSGTTQSQNNHVAYKDCGGGDCQVIFRITSPYTGSANANASVGGGFREAATQASYLFQLHSLQSGATAMQTTFGSAGTYTNTNGAGGQTRPRYGCVTYDLSLTDIRSFESADGSAWTQIAQETRALSNDLVYMFGASKSTTETLQATIDNWAVATTITCYTPGGGGSGPTFVPPVVNQSLAQNVAMVPYSIAANFTGQTLPYTIPANGSPGGLPTGSALAFNTTNATFSGTPDADDVAASPFNVAPCAVNGSGSTCTSIQFTVVAVPGDTFAIPNSASARTLNCASATGAAGANWNTLGGTGTPIAGDILQFTGATNGPITLQNCSGTYDAPMVWRNKVTDSALTIIQSTSGNGNVFTVENSKNWEFDCSGGYIGVPGGVLGVTISGGTRTRGTTQAGCRLQMTGGGGGFVMRIKGTSCIGTAAEPNRCVLRGIEFDGNGFSDVCVSMNDHAVTAASQPGGWRENVTAENLYIHECGTNNGEGLYLGPNTNNGDVPARNIAINRNIVEDTARDGVNAKSLFDGDNFITDNDVRRTGLGGSVGSQNQGINVSLAANLTISGNKLVDIGGNCMQASWTLDNFGEAGTLLYENNILSNCGDTAGSNGAGFRPNHQASSPTQVLLIRNNTVATASGDGVRCPTGTIAGFTATVTNNIFAGLGGAVVSGTACGAPSGSNNRTGTVASHNFADANNDDLHLTSTSPACNNATSNSPDTDFDGDARPLDGADEQGADEAAACPP